MSNNEFAKYTNQQDITVSPDSFPIEPSDTANLPNGVRAIRASTGGTVRCITAAGVERTLNFADTETRYVAVDKVFSTGTTATGLEGMP